MFSEFAEMIPAPGAELYCRVRPVPGGTPLLLLHGFNRTGEAEWGAPQRAFLVDYSLYIPDLRAHGRSRRRPENGAVIPHAQIGADAALVIQHFELAPAHCIGYSSGGIGLLDLLLRRPALFRSLILIASSYRLTASGAAEVRRMRNSRDADWYPEMIAELDALHREGQGAGHGERILEIWQKLAEPPGDPNLPLTALAQVPVPVLIIHPERDRFFPLSHAREMCAAIPEAELCVLPDCGHVIKSAEARTVMERAVLAFLGRVASA